MLKRVVDNRASLLVVAVLYAVTAFMYYLAATRVFEPIAGFEPFRAVLLVLMAPLMVKYSVQLLCAPLYSVAQRFRTRLDDTEPTVSVIIPAWNEEVGIVKTIQSVVDTAYPRLQVVVVNDGSTDGTHARIKQFIADHEEAGGSARITYLNLPNGGKARAMNRGLRQADGEIIVTIDADSVMDPAALDRMVECFSDAKVGGVAGNVVVANRNRPIGWMQQLEYVYGFFFKRADSLFNSVYIIGGAAAAYRREVLEKMGGFDHSIITEDIEMSTRILAHGYKTRYAADAVVYTEGPSDFKGLCNQRLRWKYGRLLTFLKHRNLFFNPRNNPYLSFFLLPLAVYAETLLLFEAAMLSTFFIYTVLTSDYMPLALVVTILTSVVFLQVAMDGKYRFHRNLLPLAPVAWLVFYAMDLIEFQALVRSLRRFAIGKELKWQRWVRVGIPDQA